MFKWLKSMLIGASYIHPFFVTRVRTPYDGKDGFEADAEAIAGDWKAVQGDLDAAIRKVKDDLGRD